MKTKKVWEKIEGEKKPFVYQKSPMEKAVEKKQQGIKQSMDAKADNIKISSASRDASLMVSTLIPFLYKNLTETELQIKWQMWRKWFFERLEDNPQDFCEPF